MPTTTFQPTPGLHTHGTPGTRSAAPIIAGFRETLLLWRERSIGRRDLRGMLQLHRSMGGTAPWQDLGVAPGELISEAEKPFWRA